MLFFKTRAAARQFAANKTTRKVVDNGKTSAKRWGVKVL